MVVILSSSHRILYPVDGGEVEGTATYKFAEETALDLLFILLFFQSVIVKSIERNIYNMFEARRQLLKLPSTGVKTPPSSSPTPLKSASSLPVTPVIRLPQSQSPHIKPQYIGKFYQFSIRTKSKPRCSSSSEVLDREPLVCLWGCRTFARGP